MEIQITGIQIAGIQIVEIQMAGITEGGAGMENKRSMGSEYEKRRQSI